MIEPIDVTGSIARLRQAGAAFAALRGPIDAGQPWPMSSAAGEGPEGEWGPPEVLAHVAEMLQYWLGEMERVVAGSPEPVPFGRVATDPLRTMTMERDRTLPARELISRIQATIDRYAARLPELTPADWAKTGLHPRLGEMSVAAMLERFVGVHLDEHAIQLTEALGRHAEVG